MEIHLTREQEARLTALRASLDAAEADIAAGRGEEITAQRERAFLDAVKQEGRARSKWQPSRAV